MRRRSNPVRVTRSLALAVRADYARGVGTKTVAALHGISHGTVSEIITGRHAWTQGMANIARPVGRPCAHEVTTYRGRRRCIHAQLAGTAAP
jgi:hypothetical protein